MEGENLHRLIGKIYDCALDTEGWSDTLTDLRDQMGFAYVSLHFMTIPPTYPKTRQKHLIVNTEWDEFWLEEVQRLMPIIPRFDEILAKDIDDPTTQLRHVPESEFQETQFFREWVKPQHLRDSCHVNILRRDNMTAQLVGAVHADREPLTDAELAQIGQLTPHIRRSLVISDMLDATRTQLKVYRSMLDHISVAVFLIGADARIAYRNSAAEALLSSSDCIGARQDRLFAASPLHGRQFEEALTRACAAEDGDLGLWGNGMVLPGSKDSAVVAYVLPLGRSEKRHELGDGLAAVVVTAAGDARPPAVEVLTALSGLTVSEARVALFVADGLSIEDIAARQGIATATVRRHLANAFDKTEARSQASLGAFVNRLRAPLRHLPKDTT